MRSLTGAWVGVVCILCAFLWVVCFYGDDWLVPWHDEVVLVRLAQNLAEGQGFRNDLLDNLLVGADRKTYWQMPLYPFVLSLWGRLVGFDLNAVRWLSRCFGLLVLVGLFVLAQRLGLPLWARFWALLWTASDTGFQFAANFARPDILLGALLLATATVMLSFPSSMAPLSLVLGFLTAAAVFTHPIALPCGLVVGAFVVWRSGWRDGVIFALPVVLGALGWLVYVAQDVPTFLAQMHAHWTHKDYPLSHRFAFLLGTTFWGVQHYLGVPVNPLPWFAVLVVSFWISLREGWLLPKRLLVFVTTLYFVVTVGAEAWYPPLFVPLGYLLLATIGSHLWSKANKWGWRVVLFALALAWWGWQSTVVRQHLQAVPKVRAETARFVQELINCLPKGAVILVGSFSPDPTFSLLSLRPDVQVYQLMPAPMVNRKQLKALREELTHLLVLEEALADPLLRGRRVQQWQFRFGGLSQPPHPGIVIVLQEIEEPSNDSLSHNWLPSINRVSSSGGKVGFVGDRRTFSF